MTTAGVFEDLSDRPDLISELGLNLTRLDLVAHYKRCGSSADFVANFLGFSFGSREQAITVLSTVLNELLENAVKFSAPADYDITVRTTYDGESILVETTNLCTRMQADILCAWVQRITDNDPEDLFIAQLERTAANSPDQSGLGFITLAKDYGASLGVRIETGTSPYVLARVQAVIDVAELGELDTVF